MITKLIVRLLTAEGELLGWAAVRAKAKGDQRLWPDEPCRITVTTSGACKFISVHWADLNVQRRTVSDRVVTIGEIVQLNWPEAIMAFDSDEGPLPAVTVGTSQITVPTGVLGAVGN